MTLANRTYSRAERNDLETYFAALPCCVVELPVVCGCFETFDGGVLDWPDTTSWLARDCGFDSNCLIDEVSPSGAESP